MQKKPADTIAELRSMLNDAILALADNTVGTIAWEAIEELAAAGPEADREKLKERTQGLVNAAVHRTLHLTIDLVIFALNAHDEEAQIDAA